MDDDVYIEPEEEGETATPEQKLKALRDKLKLCQVEAGENLAGWQRAKADYVNLQKRYREFESGLQSTATASLVKELLPLFDSIEAAGHEVLTKQLDATLTRLAVKRYRPVAGDHFDPQLHEAVSTVATNTKEEDNTIHSVMQSGYAQGSMTIRPARVTVNHYE